MEKTMHGDTTAGKLCSVGKGELASEDLSVATNALISPNLTLDRGSGRVIDFLGEDEKILLNQIRGWLSAPSA
jgi:hypothetical protein